MTGHSIPARLYHTARDYAGHWMVAGIVLAATGAAPEHWFADVLHRAHLPTEGLQLWGVGIDLRLILIGAGVLMIAGDIAWRRTRLTAEPALTSEAVEALPLPDKPSIAVLPFDNLSGDLEQEYFSDGVAEDIITELSRNRGLFVIARNSSFTYRGRAVDIKQVGRGLGVRYVLEGSVRRQGNRIRIATQLIEAGTGAHVWAERFDRDQTDVFAIQDEITQAVAVAIGPALADAEMHRAMRRPPNSLGAWDLYQQAMWQMARSDIAANNEARRLFSRAIELDPMLAAAYSGLSRCETRSFTYFQATTLDAAAQTASVHARKAIEFDPADADAHASLASTLLLQGDIENALSIARQALSLNSNCAYAWWVMGAVLVFTGRTAEGRQALAEFERLSPRDANMIAAHRLVAVSHYIDKNYEKCVEAAERQLSARPDITVTYRWLAAALGQLGHTEKARVALLKAFDPTSPEPAVYGRNRVPWMRPEDHEHLLQGLRKAGWQG